MEIRKADQRGHTELGWLHSRHTFSFGDYRDPAHMGFRALRVINDDIVEPGQGFGTHGHRDMEIISIVLDGALEHRDSLGHGEVLRPGEVQVMSAGSGIQHSEFNPSATERAHFLQVWIMPDRKSIEPAYAQKAFPVGDRINRLQRVAGGREATDAALHISRDVDVYLLNLQPSGSVTHTVRSGRAAWVHVIQGSCTVNGQALGSGDAIATELAGDIELAAENATAELLVFDLG